MDAEGRAQHAVGPARHAAALDVAQHRDPRLGAGRLGDALGEIGADAAIAHGAGGFAQRLVLALLGQHRLGDHDQREIAPGALQHFDLCLDRVEAVADLRNQDHVGAAGDPGGERDMAGIAAHHLEHHDAAVAGRGRLQPIERLGRDRDRGVEADRHLGQAEIVVDRLGNADQREIALAREPVEDPEAAVAADADHGIESERAHALDDLVGPIDQRAVRHRIGEWVAFVGRPQDGAAEPQHHAGRAAQIELLMAGRALQQTLGALANPDHLPAEAMMGAMHDRPNDRIEAGAVAAAGQNADALGHDVATPLARRVAGRRRPVVRSQRLVPSVA